MSRFPRCSGSWNAWSQRMKLLEEELRGGINLAKFYARDKGPEKP